MILKVENISKSIGKKSILKDVSFTMEYSKLYGITGENGSGKSTLLKIIAGEWKSDTGIVVVSDRLGYCPQKPLLFSHLTVQEHFHYFAAAYRIEKDELSERSEMLMNYFKFREYRGEKIANLSEGTQQKVNFSIALLHSPRLLILDEPYNGFDWETYIRFWEFTEKLRKDGCAILIVTHLITETERFDKIHKLTHGFLT